MNKKSQARIIESLLASLLIIIATIIVYTFFYPEYYTPIGNAQNITSNILGFIIENDYLKYAFINPSVLVNILYEIVPNNYGFKIALYNEYWNIIWLYQSSDFSTRNEVSSFLILNGFNSSYSKSIYILVISISKS